MINLEEFVKRNYPLIKDLGLTIKTEESVAIDSLKKYPPEMYDDLSEEELLPFLIFSIEFSDVFSTDFEGIAYDEFLEKCQNISGGELSFEDVNNEVSIETLEKGEGTSEVSFKCNGSEYKFTATIFYDWFDVKFITYLNGILEKMGIEKRFIIFGDPNGAFVTYQKPDFCKKINLLFPEFEADVA